MIAAAYETFLSIGDIVFRIASDDRRLASAADGPLAPFFAGQGPADVEIRASWTDTLPEGSGRLIFDAGEPWRLLQSGSEFLFTFRSSAGSPGRLVDRPPGKVGRRRPRHRREQRVRQRLHR